MTKDQRFTKGSKHLSQEQQIKYQFIESFSVKKICFYMLDK